MKILPSLRNSIKNPSVIGFLCASAVYLAIAFWLFYRSPAKVTAVQLDGAAHITMRLASINSSAHELHHSSAAPKPRKHKKHKPRIHKKSRSLPQEEMPEPVAETQKVDETQKASNTTQEGSTAQVLAYNEGVSDEFLSKIRLAISNNNVYPRIARIRGLQGEVMVEFILNIDGSMEGLKILQSNAGDILNQSALQAVNSACKEFPAPKHKVRIKVPIVYNLAKS